MDAHTDTQASGPPDLRRVESSSHDIYDGDDSTVDPVYRAKIMLINDAFQEIGMGKYQIVTGLILTPTVNEFGYQGPFIKLGQAIGMLIGCVVFGVGSDIWGRRWSFNLTLFITALFAIAGGASSNAVALCAFVTVWSIGVGGNLPVDSAVFLEFVPASHQYLLTTLSVFWSIGQLVGSLIAWPLISNFSCASAAACPRASNQGWRYFTYTVGGLVMLLFVLRFFVFHLYESPRYLVGRGRDAEAVDVLHRVAAYNGKGCRLTVGMLAAAGEAARRKMGESADVDEVRDEKGKEKEVGAVRAGLAASRQVFSGKHVKALFATRKLALSTTLLILMWALIGLAYALYNSYIPYFLQTRGADFGDGSVYITYRNQVILSVVGIPGAFLAGWMVELPYLGRNGTLAISTILTGAFLLASTTARTSDALLGWNCGYSLTNNVMWGVLFAVTPELFPAKDRGTGNSVVELGDRIFNLFAPVIALYADLTTAVPIWLSGALFIVAGFLAFLLPFEPRGKASI
ncbi:MFS general substrate transporter [Trametes versicolor FP-101664 SS1]|uniref:MFS general substrate transporter n=1 Tax=Trametes versicolor (strain FP-101664) TaxID=717944 RepID=UPI0004621A84|nr:MFS general substrate transporter [Trametes versicolor FP-101664 SS1]EIW59269.1 MFS general substrate transporter [Trametes versicolor FP-101664 SS1]